MSDQPHIPVMLPEVLAGLQARDGETYVDGTFGAGGYTRGILEAADCRVLGIDRDPDVRETAGQMRRVYPGRFVFGFGSFSMMEDMIGMVNVPDVNGVVLDLGVSSIQLDQAERGFSFQKDGPLDMRVARFGPTAADVVNGFEADELAAIFRIHGEERHARRAAQAIVRARQDEPITRTLQLAGILSKAVGGKLGRRIHPATRAFQGLRIYVNNELGELMRGLEAAERVLKPLGRLVVVAFHSLEDRIVKTFLRERAGLTGGRSRHQPETPPEREPSFSLMSRKALVVSEREAAENPRSRSARLRVAIRTEHKPWPCGEGTVTGVPSYRRLEEIVQ